MDDDSLLEHLPPGLIVRDDVRRLGLDVKVLYAAERRGALVRLRPGVFVRAHEHSALTPEGRHALVVRAAARRLTRGVFSHESAAALWGLPLLRVPDEVHVSVPRSSGGESRPGVVRHTRSEPFESVEHDGLTITAPAVTIHDLASARPFADALVAADSAVRAGLVTAQELVASARSLAGRRGGRRALVVASLVDPRAESPGESLSRARMHELGLPAPRLQTRLADSAGDIGRVDFWWRALRVVGEFDGRVKYRVDGTSDRRALEDRLWAEKQREDRLRAAGCRVVRWTWDDAIHPTRLAQILARAGVRPGA